MQPYFYNKSAGLLICGFIIKKLLSNFFFLQLVAGLFH
jgi:hypothetical protein